MGNFRSNNRREGRSDGFSRGRSFGGGNRSGGRSFGGERGDRGGNRFGGGRGRLEMHQAVCTKCGNRCEVPFRPSGTKPVFCSSCFSKEDSSNENSRGRSFGEGRDRSESSQSGISKEQFNQLNAKLDKIIAILNELELTDEEDEDLELDEIEDEDAEETIPENVEITIEDEEDEEDDEDSKEQDTN